MEKRIIQVEDKVPAKLLIPLSIQHMFAMFGASVLVPFLFGINPAIVLLMNGVGTLLFILITKGKAPAYLGSSFAFLSPGILVMTKFGYQYALGGFVVLGIAGMILALIIGKCGTKWIDIVLPTAAMGPVVALIGLELAGSAERVDMRSYERQGLDIIPTVHMGAAVSALERKGIETNIGNLNRDIKAANRMMNAIRSTIKSLRDWIADILEATKEAFAEVEAEKKNASPNLSNLLRDYMNLRKSERSEWSRYGQQKGTADDLKAVSKALIYLKEHELFTLEDLDTALQGVNEKAGAISKEMKTASNRMKVITAIQTAVADCKTHKAVHDKYLKIGWKARQAAYAESHKDELDSFNKAFRYLKKQGVDLNVNLDALQTEYDKLKATHTELAGQLATVKEELQPMKDIRYWVGKVLTPEQAVEKKPEPKHSVTEKMKFLQEQGKKQPEQKSPQHKKQNMEL